MSADTSLAQPETLVDAVRRSGAEAKKTGAGAIDGLAEVAERLDMAETAGRLARTAENLRSDTFNIIVMGRFKNGKSTLLNSLMGGTTHAVELDSNHGPMVVDDLPATATLTMVHYADTPSVVVWDHDGHREEWTLERYLHESTLDIDEEENQRRFGHIRQFEMGFPARLCQAGVTVFDSPGLDDQPSRTKITREASAACDAAIVVYRSDVLMGQNELMDSSELVAEGTRVFTVVNLRDGRQVDDRLRGFVWNRYVRDIQGGDTYAGQDLAERDIYFIDAKRASAGRYTGDAEAVALSGLPQFEHALGAFLTRDRQHVHLSKHTRIAGRLAESIAQHIEQRRLSVRTDRDELRRTYESLFPRLEEIRARPGRLEALFARFTEEARTVLVASFLQMIASVRRDLPDHMETVELSSSNRFTRIFRQKKLAAEAADAISAFVADRTTAWGEKEAQRLLAPIIDRLEAEISEEVAEIGESLDDIHFQLTGWEVDASETSPLVGRKERVLAAAAGMVFGDLSAAVTGGAGGFRGAAGGIAGAVTTGVTLAIAGASMTVLAPITLAAALAAGIAAGGWDLDGRIKRKIANETDPRIADLGRDIEPRMAEKVEATFDAVETAVTREIVAIVAEEERNIRQVVELNQRDQTERDDVLADLTQAATALGKHQQALAQAVVVAQQA